MVESQFDRDIVAYSDPGETGYRRRKLIRFPEPSKRPVPGRGRTGDNPGKHAEKPTASTLASRGEDSPPGRRHHDTADRDAGAPPADLTPPPTYATVNDVAPAGTRRTVDVTVVAQDTETFLAGPPGEPAPVLTATVRVPAETLLPGPRGHRFHVVDYDMTRRVGTAPATTLKGDDPGQIIDQYAYFGLTPWLPQDNDHLNEDAEFRAQNVYAVAARTLSLFEFYLGRRLSWAFESHQLHLVPRARVEANARYDRDLQAVLFGYYPDDKSGRNVYTALSHDVIAHEVTHAILDGLRPHYLDPGPPDQAAVHEGLADLVALLSVFELPVVLREALLKSIDGDPTGWRAKGRLPESAVDDDAIERSVLWKIAEQVGRSTTGRGAVRYAEPIAPMTNWRKQSAFVAPHRRCQILVAAVMCTLRDIWLARLTALTHDGEVDLERAAEEGAAAAGYILGMVIRGVDYMPPVDVTFEDVVDAVVTADEVMAPDDDGYRTAMLAAFASFGIERPAQILIDYSRDDTPWPRYTNLSFASLRNDRDEVFRFIWQNAELLGIDLNFRLYVNRVRLATRVGPDGLTVDEIVADYVQTLTVAADRLHLVEASHPDGEGFEVVEPGAEGGGPVAALSLENIAGVTDEVTLVGGGTLVFDEFARLRFHQRKALAWSNKDIERQETRLRHLVRYAAAFEERNRFAMLHCDVHYEEIW